MHKDEFRFLISQFLSELPAYDRTSIMKEKLDSIRKKNVICNNEYTFVHKHSFM